MRAHARSTDPHTSHQAAASVGDLRQSQRDVYEVLSHLGPMHDERLIEVYAGAVRHGIVRRQSDSGIRSRRAELVELGLVKDTGRTVLTAARRRTMVWTAV